MSAEYKRERLGELLLRADLITEEQLEVALQEQVRAGGKLGEALVRELVLTEEQIAQALAEQKGYEHVNLTAYPIDRNAVALMPERMARRRQMLPIGFADARTIVLVMADPLDIEAMDEAVIRTGHKIDVVVAAPTQIGYAIDKYSAGADAFQDLVDRQAEAAVSPADFDVAVLEGDDVPLVRMVNQLIREAVLDRASDIHLEPQLDGMHVRYRIDGVLTEIATLPPSAQAGVVSRVKVMSEMDITERRRPQDGRISLQMDGRPLDLRVASLPTPLGESIVIRLLNTEMSFISLNDLGLNDAGLDALAEMVRKPYGALLVSGPTGSGKSTTLYALLQEINDPSRKIITIEDPIEYRMAGLTQMSINPRIGLSFATGLRTILRADPDVVMVGEVRDPDTAEIAVRSALTGHLVLTSIHTNDAPAALTRLVDMGVAPYITSSAVLGVVAQRLARRLCPTCKSPVDYLPERLIAAGFSEEEVEAGLSLYTAVGCDECRQTGFRGRLGLFEIMPMDEDITRLYLQHAPSHALRELALEKGMVSLRRDALTKVAQGHTSLEESDRVVI